MISQVAADQIIEFIKTLVEPEPFVEIDTREMPLPGEVKLVNLFDQTGAAEAGLQGVAELHEDIGTLSEFYRSIFMDRPQPTDQNWREVIPLSSCQDLQELLLYVWDIDKNRKRIDNPFPYMRAILKGGPNWDQVRAVAARVRSQVAAAQEATERDMDAQETAEGLASLAPAEMTDEMRGKILNFAERFAQQRAGTD